jgi:hypothetical protein
MTALSLTKIPAETRAVDVNQFEVSTYSDFIAKYGLLRSDHKISQFVEQRVQQLHPDLCSDEMPRVVVLGTKGLGINAIAFSNGILALSPELIEFVNFKEELDAVILHESRHILAKHIKQTEASNDVVEVIGQLRLHEYESDVSAFVNQADPRCDSNPRGALTFFERLRDLDESQFKGNDTESWDLAHGRLTDRIALLRTVMQQFELGSSGNPLNDQLQRPLVAMPKDFKEIIRKLPQSRFKDLDIEIYPDNPNFNSWRQSIFKIVQDANNISQLELVIKAIIKMHGVNADKQFNNLPSRQRFFQELGSLRELVFKKWANKIKQSLLRADDISPRHKDIALATIAKQRLDLNLFDPKLKNLAIVSDLKKHIYGSEQVVILLSKEDIPIIEAVISSLKLRDHNQKQEILSHLTGTLFEHCAFDKVKTKGIAPKRLCRWLKYAVSQISNKEDQASSNVQENTAVSDFIESALKQAFRANEDLGGNSLGAQRGWIEAIADLAALDSNVSTAVSFCHSLSDPFAQAVISQVLSTSDINIKLEQIDALLSSFEAALMSDLSRDRLVKVAGSLVEAVAVLPEICLPQKSERLGVFQSLLTDSKIEARQTIAESGNSSSIPAEKTPFNIFHGPTRAGCAAIVLERIALLSKKTKQQDLIAKVYVGLCQASSRSQSEYDRLVTSSLYRLSGYLESVTVVISSFADRSVFVPEQFKELVSHFREPYDLREETLLVGLDQFKSAIGKTPSKELYRKSISDFLKNWTTPLDGSSSEMNEVFFKGISLFNKRPEKREDLLLLFDIGYFAPDVGMRRQIQGSVLPQILGQIKDPAEALSFIFDRYPRQLQYGLSIGTLSSIDASLRKPTDFIQLEHRLKDIWNSTAALSSRTASVVAADALSHAMQNLDKSEFLEAIVSSFQGDEKLRLLLLRAWYLIDRESVRILIQQLLAADSTSEQDNAIRDFRSEGEESQSREFSFQAQSPNLWLQQLYALGPFERMALLRDAINGHGGVLTRKDGRQKLLDILFENILSGSQQDPLSSELRQVSSAFLNSATNDQLSEILVATLADKVLRPPTTVTSWESAIRDFINENTSIWLDLPIGAVISSFKPKGENLEIDLDELNDIDEWEDRNDSLIFRSRIRQVMPPLIQRVVEGKRLEDVHDMSKMLNDLEIISSEVQNHKALSPLDFITEVGSRLGAAGVRVLQLAGQLVNDLDPAVKDRLMHLYDAVSGQSAICAWQTLGKVCPDHRSLIETLGPKLGGGSIYTVFLAAVKGEEWEALRIMNPNALALVQENLDLLKRTVEALIEHNSAYKVLVPILDLVSEWINAEMKDRDFQKDDPTFRSNWNKWAPEWALSKGLSVLIPESKPLSASADETVIKIVRDQYIPDVTNFTQANKLDPKVHQDMAALGVQFYLAQIIGNNPFAESLVLSDISKGNAGITKDTKQLVVFDRGMYLKLSLEEKLQLKTIVDVSNVEEAINAIVGLLKSFPENKKRSADKMAKDIRKYIKEQSETEDSESLAFKSISHLFSQGLYLPLKWSLLLKNINAWKQIVTEAGFSSLQAALAYEGN